MTEETQVLNRVMVIAAHPDDMEFGCAGTIAKMAEQGKEITLLLLTSGDKGSHDHTLRPDKLADRRENEQRAANKVLGVKDVIFLRHPDGQLEYSMFLRRQLAEIIRRHKPHIVFAIDPWRLYQLAPDHRVAGEAALDALWAAREWNIFPEQLTNGEEPWRVKEAYLFWTDHTDHYEDITSTIDKRIEALACHVSQVGEDRAKLDERLRERTRKVAEEGGEATVGFTYAEGFKKLTF
ncbi:PIG-L family deacetylase [bacterium]|nr:PIG-L family deacetylase [bacterium]